MLNVNYLSINSSLTPLANSSAYLFAWNKEIFWGCPLRIHTIQTSSYSEYCELIRSSYLFHVVATADYDPPRLTPHFPLKLTSKWNHQGHWYAKFRTIMEKGSDEGSVFRSCDDATPSLILWARMCTLIYVIEMSAFRPRHPTDCQSNCNF